MKSRPTVLVMASGGGSDAAEIVKYSKTHYPNIDFIGGSDMAPGHAGIYGKLENLGVEVHHFSTDYQSAALRNFLRQNPNIKLVALAGYRANVPDDLTGRAMMTNIHPGITSPFNGDMSVYKNALESGDRYFGTTVYNMAEKYYSTKPIAQIAFERDMWWDLSLLSEVAFAHTHALYAITVAKLVLGSALDIDEIAAEAQNNITARGLPGTHTIIPVHGATKFQWFNTKKFSPNYMKKYEAR
ncbi:MAG: hypothetical protein FWD15_01355 [Alphaproteobacteria bacterium]|nr:hypothetical protein [Alphaproteobacteria bacterium]